MTESKFYFHKIGIVSDHVGIDLKSRLIDSVRRLGLEIIDFGPSTGENKVDYPDYASLLAEAVSQRKVDGGIAICGTGIGMSISSNKYSHVRATCVWDEYSCRMSRLHNDANIICLGARAINHDRAIDLVSLWLSSSFAGERHKTRIDKITEIEKKNFKNPRS